MAKAQTAQVVITANAKVARAVLDELKRKAQDCKNQMQALANAGQQNTKAFKEAQKQFEAYNGAIAQNISNTVRVEKVMKDLANTSTRDLKRALGAAKKELEGMASTNPKLKEWQNNIARIKKQIEANTGALKQHNQVWQTAVRNITAYVGVFQAFNFISGKLRTVFADNLKLSDSLADIRKVSGLAMTDINNLSRSLAKIETRSTVQELNSIAYAGAKLGIGKWGVEALEQFVQASNQVNVALKEDLGDDALTALSKITEVMGLIPKMGVERSMLATGSAMFQLSATSTATAGNIVEFAKRLTGMARTAGISTDQLLALGSAADSMYLMPEVASTAFNKFITSLQTKHNLIENELSITPGTINQLYSAGKIIDAMVLVFQKMKEKGNMNALQSVFKDLGSDGARLTNVMVTMAKNVDMLEKHLETSKEAFEEGTAVTKEYRIQQETAQAVMERANNLWEKAFVNPEGVDTVKEMSQAWYDLSKSLTNNGVAMWAMKKVIGLIAVELGVLLKLLPVIVTALMFKGAVASVNALAHSINLMGQEGLIATARTNGLAAAWRTLNSVQKANVIILIVSLLASLAIGLADVINSTKKATESFLDLDRTMNDFNNEFGKAEGELKRYRDAVLKAAKGTNEHKAAIKNFNDKFGSYLSNLLTEKSTAEDVAKAYQEVVKQLKAKIALQLREKDIEKNVTPRLGWQADRLSEYDQLSGGSAYNGTWLKGYIDDMRAAGKTIEEINNDLAKKLGVSGEIAADAYKSRSRKSPTTWTDTDAVVNDVTSNYYMDNAEMAAYSMGSTQSHTHQLTQAEKMLYAATRYAAQKYSTDNALAAVEQKWKPFEDDMAASVVSEIESPGTLDNEAPDKDAIKAAKQAKLEQMKAWREELKQAQDEAKAVIDNIKNFYERQITEVLRTANEQNWDTSLTQAAVRSVEGRMNLALSQARKSIAGVQNTWEEFKGTMTTDMREMANEEGYNESQVLLNEITTTNIAALRQKMMALAKNLNTPESAVTDAIWKNASLNEKANETAEQKRRKAVQARLLDDNFTAKVDDQHTQAMEDLGFFDLDADQTTILLAGGKDATELIQRRTDEIASVLENARTRIKDLYQVDDVTTEQGRNQLLTILFGPSWDQYDSELKSIFDLYGDDMQAFYLELIKYSDDYTEALKRSRERQKKILDFKWGLTDQYHANDDAQKANDIQKSGVARYAKDSKTNSQPRNDIYGSAHFMESMGVDPEIESYRLKMEAAQAYYDFLAAHHADAELLRNAEQAILASEIAYVKSVAEQMKQRISDVYSLAKPVEDFGTAMGKAFAVMTEDAEEGKKAVKAAIAEMINGFMKQTIEMTEEYIKRRMMQQMNDRLTSMQMRRAAAEQQAIREQSAIAESNGRTLDLKNNKADRQAVKDRTKYLTKHPDEITPTSALEGPTGAATDPLYVSIVGGMPGTPGTPGAPGAPGGVPTPSSGTPTYPAGAPVPSASPVGGTGVSAVGSRIVSQSGSAVGYGVSQMANGDVAGGASAMAGGVISSLGGSAIDAGTQALEKSLKKKKKLKDKAHKETVKADKKAAKDEQKIETQKQDAIVETTQEGGEARQLLTETVGAGIQSTTAELGQQLLATQQTQTNAEVQTTAAKTQADTVMGIASGSSHIIGTLGWWGIPLIAVITALLNGLLSFAMSKVSSLFGGGNSADTGPSTKLVSGMLTYDAGNVQAFRGAIDGKTYPVVGSDGNVYAAKDGGELSTGLVSDPITTLVNGQPALVAEKGPEMVIGRETTAAMMMARPDIIQEIVKFDKNRSGQTYRAYDAGNLSELFASMQSASSSPQSSESAEALTATLSSLATVLATIQSKGIPAHINKYGRGSVTQEAADGSRFMRNYSGDRLWRDK